MYHRQNRTKQAATCEYYCNVNGVISLAALFNKSLMVKLWGIGQDPSYLSADILVKSSYHHHHRPLWPWNLTLSLLARPRAGSRKLTVDDFLNQELSMSRLSGVLISVSPDSITSSVFSGVNDILNWYKCSNFHHSQDLENLKRNI